VTYWGSSSKNKRFYGWVLLVMLLLPKGSVDAAVHNPPLDTSAAAPITGLWWNENEAGWGITLTQQVDIIFVTMFTYDTNGFPHWYVASDCAVSGDGCSGDLFELTGGSPPTDTWNPLLVLEPVGTIVFTFTDNDTGSVEYTINGLPGSRQITRQIWAIDEDGDGVSTRGDAFPNDPSESKDSDGDGIGDNTDNCVNTINQNQIDSDGDGVGDACEPAADTDGDGVDDNNDNCPSVSNADQADADRDGIGDACEPVPSGASFAEVQSIFNQNCIFCHGSNGNLTLSSSVSFSNLVNVPSAGLPTLNRVEPGNSDNSYIIWKLEGRPGIVGSQMPLGGQLSAANIQIIASWIDAGALP